jgi:hypothetical protein
MLPIAWISWPIEIVVVISAIILNASGKFVSETVVEATGKQTGTHHTKRVPGTRTPRTL